MFINPIIFYLIGLCDRLNAILTITAILAFIIGAFSIGLIAEDYGYGDNLPKFKAALKKSVIVFVISILGIVFIPSAETATKMLIGSQITQENVEKTKDIVDYIIDKIKEIKE